MSGFQTNYTTRAALVGSPHTVDEKDIISVSNPLVAQVGLADVNSGTTDGNYRLQVLDERRGAITTSDAFVASSDSAAAIAAGVVSAWNAGALSSSVAVATVVNVDQVQLAFTSENRLYTLSWAEDASAGALILANSTEPGFSVVPAGIILQAAAAAGGSGGFTTTYSTSILAKGVVLRSAGLSQSLENQVSNGGYDGAKSISVARRGTVWVQGAAGVTLADGNDVFFNSTAATWSNVATGSHIRVRSASWHIIGRTGTGIQPVYFDLPSDAA